MKCVAFDLGKVLFDFDYNIALEKIKDKVGVDISYIIDALFYKDFAGDFERGEVGALDFYNKFKRAFKADISFEEFKSIWCEIFWPKEDVIEFLERLRTVYPIYLISNINELHFFYLYKKFSSVFSLFDDLILSFKVKATKPDIKIYEELKKITALSYREIIYIDDREDLVDEAKNLELNTIKFNSLKELIPQLEKYSIFCPSRKETDILLELKKHIKNSKNTLLIGMGNRLRSDDMVGSSIIEALDGRLTIETLDVKESLENYLGRIKASHSSLVIFLDSAYYNEEERFRLFSPSQLQDHFYLTHDSSLHFVVKYLQKDNSFDILLVGIKGYDFFLGETMSKETLKGKYILENFFMRNFCKDNKVK